MAAVSHEFRTPLTALRQCNDLVADCDHLAPERQGVTYRVELETRARREYRDLPARAREPLTDVIDDLQADPGCPEAKDTPGATDFGCEAAIIAFSAPSIIIYSLFGSTGSAVVARSFAGTSAG